MFYLKNKKGFSISRGFSSKSDLLDDICSTELNRSNGVAITCFLEGNDFYISGIDDRRFIGTVDYVAEDEDFELCHSNPYYGSCVTYEWSGHSDELDEEVSNKIKSYFEDGKQLGYGSIKVTIDVSETYTVDAAEYLLEFEEECGSEAVEEYLSTTTDIPTNTRVLVTVKKPNDD